MDHDRVRWRKVIVATRSGQVWHSAGMKVGHYHATESRSCVLSNDAQSPTSMAIATLQRES